ncbi:MAG: aminoglycoside phosphotransferase family protein [Syntrophobacteria bacterium]
MTGETEQTEWQSRAERMVREETGLAGPFWWNVLHGDGSERIFYRMETRSKSLVLIRSPCANDTFPNENDSYVYMGRHLYEKGINVPRIYAYCRSEGLILMEDLGSVHLQDQVKSARGRLAGLYQQAAELLIDMQVRATEDLDTRFCFDSPIYDPAFVLERELEYFRQAFLVGGLGLEVGRDDVAREFALLASRACGGEEPLFFLHRDFQSRNLMVNNERLYVIDFQGARLGPPQYDLAALLLDPYVQVPGSIRDHLLAAHGRRLSEMAGISLRDFLARYPHVALCRNLQVLAAFAFLTRMRGRAHFADYVIPAWHRLVKILAEPPCMDYRILATLVQGQSTRSIAAAAARLRRQAHRATERAGHGARRSF